MVCWDAVWVLVVSVPSALPVTTEKSGSGQSASITALSFWALMVLSVAICTMVVPRLHAETSATGVSTGGTSLTFASCVCAASASPWLEYTEVHVSPETSDGVTISPLSRARLAAARANTSCPNACSEPLTIAAVGCEPAVSVTLDVGDTGVKVPAADEASVDAAAGGDAVERPAGFAVGAPLHATTPAAATTPSATYA